MRCEECQADLATVVCDCGVFGDRALCDDCHEKYAANRPVITPIRPEDHDRIKIVRGSLVD